jgi:hypothetical protein
VEDSTVAFDSLAQSRPQQLKLLCRLVSLSCLLSLVNSLTSATIADKDGSIKASDRETVGLLQLHSFGLSELRGAAVGPQLHVPHAFMDADAELRPCDTKEDPSRGGRLEVETA